MISSSYVNLARNKIRMAFKNIQTEYRESILIARINRPEVKNAMNVQFIRDLDCLLEEVLSRKDIRAIIITGNNEAFASGGDISEMLLMGESQAYEVSRLVHHTFSKIETLPIPVIAAVNGLAMGGGCELVMWCDFCIAASDAVFALPEGILGIIPGGGGTQLFSRISGKNNALYFLMTGDSFSAEKAMQMGIVQHITSPENVILNAISIAEKIIKRPGASLRELKQVVVKGQKADFSSALKMEAEAFGRLVGNEGKKGLKTFFEKKKQKD